MNLKLNVENGKSVICIKGDIDIQGSSDLKNTLNTVLENGSLEVFLDFEGVTFIGTSGISTLLSFSINFTALGGKVNIINLDNEIGSMFETIHLDKYFSF